MTYPHSPQPGPRPGPPPGGPRPGPGLPGSGLPGSALPGSALPGVREQPEPGAAPRADGSTGHPAVDAVLQALANAAPLAPAEQIAEYEAAHRVLQETLSGIDG